MKRKSKKGKKIRPDEQYNIGPFQLARFGEKVLIRNNLTSEQHETFMADMAEQFESKKLEIDNKVFIIKDKIAKCNPITLLDCAYSLGLMTHLGKSSEIDYSTEEINLLRSIEYIQSVLVSSENMFDGSKDVDNYQEIIKDIEELYENIFSFFHYWYPYTKLKEPDINDALLHFIVEAQVYSFIRGKRYQAFEFYHIEKLLKPHNDVFLSLFNISIDAVLEGLKKIQYATIQGKFDAYMELKKLYNEFIDSGLGTEDFRIANESKLKEVMTQCFGQNLNNVKSITNWPQTFIDSLSFHLNEYTTFYYEGDYSGWPILDLPSHKKPFIVLDGESYCFDYYSLFDHFYRVMQKTIVSMKPDYVDEWARLQQDASESMVANIFQKLLPGCQIYRDNYYPLKGTSLKEMAENDVIVLYDNVIIIVEVKAGSYTYTSPLIDIKSHINSLEKLIEKADHQCFRAYKYIEENKEATFYTHGKEVKTIIKQKDYKYIYTFAVTVDSFNEFAAKAEKLSFIKLKSNSISISADDLLVYSEYFSSPLYFLHFLKHRKEATITANIEVNDELDHLGMYIKHNYYSMYANDFGRNVNVNWNGYRQELDAYFMHLNNPINPKKKPQQEIPSRITEIIDVLETKQIQERVSLANYLLDMDGEMREETHKMIELALSRQKATGRMSPILSVGSEVRYCLFVHQSGIDTLNDDDKNDYIYSTILNNNEDDRMAICLFYTDSNSLTDIEFSLKQKSSIPVFEYERLAELGQKNAQRRILAHKKKHGTKIGRNDPCPCGSGKKYKRCCGDN